MTEQNTENDATSEFDYVEENWILNFLIGLKGTGPSFILFMKNYFSFEGRTSRYDFWAPLLFGVGIIILLAFFEDVSGQYPINYFLLFMIPPILSGCVRRFHDINKRNSYFFALIAAIYILYLIYDNIDTSTSIGVTISTLATIFGISCTIRLFYLLLKTGDTTDNSYGTPPPPETKEQYPVFFIAVIVPASAAFGYYFVALFNNLVAYFSL